MKKVSLLLLSGLLFVSKVTFGQQENDLGYMDITPYYPALTPFDDTPTECPPCFNCMLPGFECLHFANCSEYDGKCNCPPGFGGNDCKQPSKFFFVVSLNDILNASISVWRIR